MTEAATAPLTGKALLQKIKDLSHLPRREKARLCGYYTGSKDEQVRVNLSEFMEAVLNASGTPIGTDSGKDGRGREPTYRVSVHKNGQIVIGSTYTEKMGLQPGDEFEIKLGYKHIQLIKLDGVGSESDDMDE
ncbi:MAG: AbrB family transcriptional regulator [Cyanobacteria bacterium P01_A01_bin.37]